MHGSLSRRTTIGWRAVAAGAAPALAIVLGACGTTSPSHSAPGSNPAAGGAGTSAPELNPAGDIPDNQVFVDYTPPSGGYHVKVPEGWARSETAGAVVFTDKLNRVRMESTAAASAPTVPSATQTEVPTIKAAAKNYEPGKVTEVTRQAGPAVLITYRADSDPNPVTGKVIRLQVERYEFWRNGTEVILTLSGPVGADNADPWRVVTDSFGWR